MYFWDFPPSKDFILLSHFESFKHVDPLSDFPTLIVSSIFCICWPHQLSYQYHADDFTALYWCLYLHLQKDNLYSACHKIPIMDPYIQVNAILTIDPVNRVD